MQFKTAIFRRVSCPVLDNGNAISNVESNGNAKETEVTNKTGTRSTACMFLFF